MTSNSSFVYTANCCNAQHYNCRKGTTTLSDHCVKDFTLQVCRCQFGTALYIRGMSGSGQDHQNFKINTNDFQWWLLTKKVYKQTSSCLSKFLQCGATQLLRLLGGMQINSINVSNQPKILLDHAYTALTFILSTFQLWTLILSLLSLFLVLFWILRIIDTCISRRPPQQAHSFFKTECTCFG